MLTKVKFITLFVIGVFICLIFLWFCPPPSGKYNFNIIVLIASIICFIYGFIKQDFTLCGLLIPVGNGLSRLIPYPYPTTSFLCFCLFLGFWLSIIKKKDFKFNQTYNKNNIIVDLTIGFYVITVLSGVFHIINLTKPGLVFFVNRAGMTNMEIVYHIVGYILFPLSCAIFLFLLTKNFLNKEDKFFLMLSVGCIISSIVGILQSAGIAKGILGYTIPWEPRVNGLFSNFNSFSLSLALLVPMFCYYFFNINNFVKKMVFFTAAGLGFICLFLTGTRSGILLIIVFLILYLTTLLLQGKYNLMISVGVKILVLLFITVIVFTIFKIEKIYAVNRIKKIFTQSVVEQIKARQVFWSTGLSVWKKNILFGGGIKSVYKEFSNINPVRIFSDSALNIYIQYLAEKGIVGFIVFLLFAGLLVYSLFAGIIKKEGGVSFIVKILIISFLVVSFFHSEEEEVLLIFWFYIGIVSKKFFDTKIKKFVNRFVIFLTVLYFFSGIFSFTKQVDIFKYSYVAGVYPKEVINSKEFHWSDKIVMFNTSSFANRKLLLELNPAGIQQQSVVVKINRNYYTTVNLLNNQWNKYVIDLMPEYKLVEILPQKTFCPAGKLRYIFPFNGKDYRRLGVMIRYYIS